MSRTVVLAGIALLMVSVFPSAQAQNPSLNTEPVNAASTAAIQNLDAILTSRDVQPLRDWLGGLDPARAKQPDALRIRARLAQIDGDLDQADALIEQALELAPDASEVRSRLLADRATLHLSNLDGSGMFRSLRIARAALDDLEQAVELDPEYVPALFGLLQYHSNAPAIAGGRKARAEELREQLSILAPATLMGMDAVDLLGQDQSEDALAQFDAALASGPNPSRPLWLLYKSVALQRLEQFEQAVEVLEQAISEYPQHAGLWYQRGRASAESGLDVGRGLEAMLRFNELLKWPGDPEPAAAWWRIGQLQQALGRIDGAREAFEYSLSLDPENEESRQSLDALEAAETG